MRRPSEVTKSSEVTECSGLTRQVSSGAWNTVILRNPHLWKNLSCPLPAASFHSEQIFIRRGPLKSGPFRFSTAAGNSGTQIGMAG